MTSSPAPESPKGSNKLWLWITLGGCGGMLLLGGLLIAGIVGGAVWYVFNELNFSLSPQTAEDLAQNMMDYEMPGDARGLVSSADFLGAEIAVVQSLEPDDTTTLMLGKVPPAAQDQWGTRPEDFLQIFEEEEVLAVIAINVESTVTESRSLCGETATVRVSEGTEAVTDKPASVYEAIVTKEGFMYMVSLTATGPNHKTAADQVFSSLDCK